MFPKLFSKEHLPRKSSDLTQRLKMILWRASLYQLFTNKFALTVFVPRYAPLSQNQVFIISFLGFVLTGVFCYPLSQQRKPRSSASFVKFEVWELPELSRSLRRAPSSYRCRYVGWCFGRETPSVGSRQNILTRRNSSSSTTLA